MLNAIEISLLLLVKEKLKALPLSYDAIQLLEEAVSRGNSLLAQERRVSADQLDALKKEVTALHEMLKARDETITKLEAQRP